MLNYADASHIEIQTTKGSLLHYIYKYAEFDIIERLIIDFEINPLWLDYNGKRAIDLLNPEQKEYV